MYLFVFIWVPALQEVTPPPYRAQLPLGYIFSCFMVSMMLGSLIYSSIVTYYHPSSPASTKTSSSSSSSNSTPGSSSTNLLASSSLSSHYAATPSQTQATAQAQAQAQTRPRPTNTSPTTTTLTLHAKLSSLTCATSALALFLAAASGSQILTRATGPSAEGQVRFWAFCVFEVCVGVYYPVQGLLRGLLVSNEHRATVSCSFFPFPFLFPFCRLIGC